LPVMASYMLARKGPSEVVRAFPAQRCPAPSDWSHRCDPCGLQVRPCVSTKSSPREMSRGCASGWHFRHITIAFAVHHPNGRQLSARSYRDRLSWACGVLSCLWQHRYRLGALGQIILANCSTIVHKTFRVLLLCLVSCCHGIGMEKEK
jgi:hypothetical protein